MIDMLTAKEVARLLKVSPQVIYHWAKERKLPFYQIERTIRFDRTEIEEWIRLKRQTGIFTHD